MGGGGHDDRAIEVALPADTEALIADAAAWAEEVRLARRRIIESVSAGTPLSSLAESVAESVAVGTGAGPHDVEVLAETRILVLCEARPGAGKVASRRALAAHGVEELARFADVAASVLAALDQVEAASP